MINSNNTIRPVTQRFTLSNSTKTIIKDMIPNFGFNGLGEVVFRRTYSRDNENWGDVVIRVIQGVMSIRKDHFYKNTLEWKDNNWQEYAKNMAVSLFKMEWMPPGRGLWMMGTDFTYNRGGMALNNCFSGDTGFWTASKGLKAFKSYNNGDKVTIRGRSKWIKATVHKYEHQRLYKIILEKDGVLKSIHTTSNHRWITLKGKNKESILPTSLLEKGHVLQNVEMKDINSIKRNNNGVSYGVSYATDWKLLPETNPKSYMLNAFIKEKDDVNIFGTTNINADFMLGIVAGMFAVNGTVDKHGNLLYTSNCPFNTIWLRNMLFKLHITSSKAKVITTNNSTLKIAYLINIDTNNIPASFFILVTHSSNFKLTPKSHWRVVNVRPTDRVEPVWCISEPTNEEFTLEGGILTKNCAATDTIDDVVLSAEWTMDCLMNGVGVGFTTYWRGEATKPDKKDSEVFAIPDTREGWVRSLITLMCAYINSPKYGTNKFPIFDYTQIRKKGLKIKGFGGLSSGPDPLKKLHTRVELFCDSICTGRLKCTSKTWKEINGTWKEVEVKVDKPYTHTRFIADVFNSIGACVVAGNVRRSAEICLGNVEDDTFINLKNYKENPERGQIGWMSNNSIVLKPDCDYEHLSCIPEMAKRIIDNGEPGFVNLVNIQKYGRYGKKEYDNATLTNPCGEIQISDKELCNLAENFPSRCENKEIFYKSLEYSTFYATTVSLLPTHRPESNAIVSKNRRIGVSISGIAQWASGEVPEGWGVMNYAKMTKFLEEGYKIVKSTNIKLANQAGVPPAIRVTTVKPSGSISLLAGVTPGMHYPVSRYAIRRMRIGMDSPLVDSLKAANIPYEKDRSSDNTLVFEFMIDHGKVRPCDEVSPWEQFSLLATLQRCWSDNSVSATIYFDKVKDAKDVEKMLAMYIPVLKSVSMLPHAGHGYEQAPYEPVDREKYLERLSKYSIPDFNNVKGNVPEGSRFCTGDKCMIPDSKRQKIKR